MFETIQIEKEKVWIVPNKRSHRFFRATSSEIIKTFCCHFAFRIHLSIFSRINSSEQQLKKINHFLRQPFAEKYKFQTKQLFPSTWFPFYTCILKQVKQRWSTRLKLYSTIRNSVIEIEYYGYVFWIFTDKNI